MGAGKLLKIRSLRC